MSHELGFDSVYEKLVLLEHFALGSQRYCAVRLSGSEKDQGDDLIDGYWGWLKGIVSPYLIECAVRARIFQDTVKETEAQKLADLDLYARSGLRIGTILTGRFELSLRETCNKIIHAKKAIPQWKSDKNIGVEYKYWNGDYCLTGTKQEIPWELMLHVAPWARAMAIYLDQAQSAELMLDIGQDWY